LRLARQTPQERRRHPLSPHAALPHDKPIAEADTLDALKPLLAELGGR
jgi:hypothetical protein